MIFYLNISGEFLLRDLKNLFSLRNLPDQSLEDLLKLKSIPDNILALWKEEEALENTPQVKFLSSKFYGFPQNN